MLKNEFDTTNIDEGNDFLIIFDKVRYTITTTLNQKNNKNNNGTIINLDECEDKLKEKYNISKNDSLYILKIDVPIENMIKVGYELYYPFIANKMTKLNLSICKNIKIKVSIPIEIPPDEIDKYNISSGLYNDICYILTSENGSDEPLKDRQNDFINNNISVCEEDCDFTEYDDIKKKALYSCFIKMKLPLISEIKVDKEKLYSNFKNIKNIGNFKMLKCFNLLLGADNIFKNFANYILMILFPLSVISLFVFLCYNYNQIKKIINQFWMQKKLKFGTIKKINNLNIKNENKKIKKVKNKNHQNFNNQLKGKNKIINNRKKLNLNLKQNKQKNPKTFSLKLNFKKENSVNSSVNKYNQGQNSKTLLNNKKGLIKRKLNKNKINNNKFISNNISKLQKSLKIKI